MNIMKKIEFEYQEKYGDISKDEVTRFYQLMNSIKITNKYKCHINDIIKKRHDIKWKCIDFIIYLEPKATPRPRINRFTNSFYVQGSKDNRDIFNKFFINENIPMITTPCKFKCVSYLPIPKTMNPIETILAELGLIYPISKPDWDNLGKTYSDMIQNTLLLDDSLIIEGISKKFYSYKPRIEIHMEYMESFDSIYNEEKITKKIERKKKQ